MTLSQTKSPRFDERAWTAASAAILARDRPSERTSDTFYLLSNELWTGEVYKDIAGRRGHRGGGHIGVSALENFNIASTRKSSFVVFINNNSLETAGIDVVLTKLQEPKTSRERFAGEIVDTIRRVIPDCGDFNSDFGPIDKRMEAELQREGSFLASDKAFEFVQRLVGKGRVLNISLDLTARGQFSNLVSDLVRQGLMIDSVYLSNVWDHVDPFGTRMDKLELAISVGCLMMSRDAIVIDAESREMRYHPRVAGSAGEVIKGNGKFSVNANL